MLEFKAVAERSYTIEYREALGSTPWDRLADVDAASSDRVVQLPDPAGTGTRFYRLRTPKGP